MGKQRIHFKRTCEFCGNVQQSRGTAYFSCVACGKTNWLRDDLKPAKKTFDKSPSAENEKGITPTPAETLSISENPPNIGENEELNDLTNEDLLGKPEGDEFACGDCGKEFSGMPEKCPHCGEVLDW